MGSKSRWGNLIALKQISISHDYSVLLVDDTNHVPQIDKIKSNKYNWKEHSRHVVNSRSSPMGSDARWSHLEFGLMQGVDKSYNGVLEKWEKDHEETGEEVDVDCLEVGHLGQSGHCVRGQCSDGEHGGHSETHSSVVITIQPKWDPRYDHYKTSGKVDLVEVETQWSC